MRGRKQSKIKIRKVAKTKRGWKGPNLKRGGGIFSYHTAANEDRGALNTTSIEKQTN